MTKKVAILVYDEVELLDFAGPGEVFEIAGYDLYTVAESTDMITSQNFLFLKPQYDLGNCPKPDILLLDLSMPKHPGLEALRDLSQPANASPVRVILLTAAAEKSQIVEALQVGARGVVLKDSATQLLLKAIQTVMAGEYWVGRESVSNLVQYLRTLMQSSHDEARQKKFGLTPREIEIVSAVVAGFSNKEIAEYFKISEDTVKHHLSNIFDKLGVSTRLELALFAVNQALPLKTIG